MSVRPTALLLALLLVALGVVGSGCAGKKRRKLAEQASRTAEETYRQGLAALARRDLNRARETLQEIQFEGESDSEIEPLARLALADATYYQGTQLGYIDARSLYLDFVTLYGDHALAPYAQLQAGRSSLEQVNHPTKDQSQTEQAIADLQEVIRRFPRTPWAQAAQSLIGEAQAHLAEHEFLVGKFYYDKKSWQAAADRFRRILERFPDHDEIAKIYFYLGQSLRETQATEEARIYLDKLVTDYPNSPFAAEARRALAAAGGPVGLEPQEASP